MEFCNRCFESVENRTVCEKCGDTVCDQCMITDKCIICAYKNCKECNILQSSEEMSHIHNNKILEYEEYYFCKECFQKNYEKYQKIYDGFNI